MTKFDHSGGSGQFVFKLPPSTDAELSAAYDQGYQDGMRAARNALAGDLTELESKWAETGFSLSEVKERENSMSKQERTTYHFAIAACYVVTANADGSIPLNAKIAARLDDLDDTPLTKELVFQANAYDADQRRITELEAALLEIVETDESFHGSHRYAAIARAALAKEQSK